MNRKILRLMLIVCFMEIILFVFHHESLLDIALNMLIPSVTGAIYLTCGSDVLKISDSEGSRA